MNLVECFDSNNHNCCILPVCSLKSLFGDAMEQFFVVLNRVTLVDLVERREDYIAVLPANIRARRPIPKRPKL